MSAMKEMLVVVLGVWIRYSLRFSAYYKQLSRRVEISTPVTGWNRVAEGIRLRESNISPYSGDTFHETPIFLYFYTLLSKAFTEHQIGVLFIVVDLLTAYVLGQIVVRQLKSMKSYEQQRLQEAAKKEQRSDKDKKLDLKSLTSNLLLQQEEDSVRFWSQSIYLLSPYSILACVGQSTGVFATLLFALTILFATNHHRFLSLFILSLLSVNSLYPVILLPAVVLMLEQKTGSTSVKHWSVAVSLVLFVGFVVANTVICNLLEGDESYYYSVYGFVLRTEELSPNIGLFWYFFTEMFDHFREFFVWVFQMNSFLFVAPLTVRFWRSPFFLTLALLFLNSLFKPYPTFSDFVLYLSILPMWSHLFKYMKSILVVSVIFSLITVFLPIQWYLWIDLGTANANFYFGMTLAYNCAQIFLITDLMFAFVKREFFFDNLHLYQLSLKANKNVQVELQQ